MKELITQLITWYQGALDSGGYTGGSQDGVVVWRAGREASGGLQVRRVPPSEIKRRVEEMVNLILLSGLRPDEDIKIEFSGMRPGEKLYEELSSASSEFWSSPANKHRGAGDTNQGQELCSCPLICVFLYEPIAKL